MSARVAITPDPMIEYTAIGVRSFGRGIFHYEPKPGDKLGSLRFFDVRPGRLVVSNIKGWEGAITVSSHVDDGCVASNRFLQYVPRDHRIDVRWASWFFLSERGIELIQRASPGSADRNRTLAIDRFEALEIPLPPIEEQERVADRLEAVAAGARLLEDRFSLSGARVKALVESWLNAQFKAVTDAVTLIDVAEVVRGRGPKYQSGSGVLAVNQACVRWDGVDLGQAREIDESWSDVLPTTARLSPGDVLVNSTGEGTIGRATVAGEDQIGLPFDSHVLVVRCDETRLSPRYLAAFLRSPLGQEQVNSSKGANTTKQTELGKTKLERFSVPLPAMHMQQAVVQRLDTLLEAMRSVQTAIAYREALRRALLPAQSNEAFAGLN